MMKKALAVLVVLHSTFCFSMIGKMSPLGKEGPSKSIAIISFDDKFNKAMCTGLLIGKRTVLTARHCLPNTAISWLFSRPGEKLPYLMTEAGMRDFKENLRVYFPVRNRPLSLTAMSSVFSRKISSLSLPQLSDIAFPPALNNLFEDRTLFEDWIKTAETADVVVLELENDAPINYTPYDISKLEKLENFPQGDFVSYGIDHSKLAFDGKNFTNIVPVENKNLRLTTEQESRKLKSDTYVTQGRHYRSSDLSEAYWEAIDEIWSENLSSLNLTTFSEDTLICEGDSGGPMFVEHDGEYILLGVTHGAASDQRAKIGKAVVTCGHTITFSNLNVIVEWLKKAAH